MANQPASRGSRLPPIVCISNAEWDAPIPTNRQQLMRRFAERTPVVYVEAPLPVLGSVLGHSRNRRRRHGWRQEDRVHILQAWDWLPYPIAKRSSTLSRVADARFRRYLVREWRGLGWSRPLLWLFAPDAGDLLGAFDERLSVYHCVDDYGSIELYNGYRRVAAYSDLKREEHLAQAVDLMVVTAPKLLDRWQGANPHLYLLPNVADTALFEQALEPGPDHPVVAAIPAPHVVFLGALDRYKVDLALLAAVARRCPSVHFVCAGPIGTGDRTQSDKLPQASNLHYVGPLPQRELPAVLRTARACIIPYHLNDYTASVSPLKLYEYLAAGQPVVSTPLPSLLSVTNEGLLLSPPDPALFAARIEEAIRIDAATRRRISVQASGHSWDRRIDELEALILEHLASAAGASVATEATGIKATMTTRTTLLNG